MIGAFSFAFALAAAGYLIGGWIMAAVLGGLFLATLPFVNYLVAARTPENINAIFAFQTAKWLLAGVLLAGAVTINLYFL